MTDTYDKAYIDGPPKASAPEGVRRQEVELLRIVSAFGIVWYHNIAIPGQDIGYAGLIVFTILSMYFAARGDARPRSVAQRARALLVPWLAWFVFFGCCNLLKREPFLPLEHGLLSAVLLGTSVHLWYLPFIFFVIVLFDRIKLLLSQQLLAYASIALALGLLLSCSWWRGPSLAFHYPYAQYMHAAPAVFIGVFLANCRALSRNAQALLVAALLLTIAWYAMPMRGIGTPYLLGVSAAAATLLPNWRWAAALNVNWLSECTLGIYLSHVFWTKLLSKLLTIPQMLLPCLVFVVSALAIWTFRKTLPKLARYVV